MVSAFRVLRRKNSESWDPFRNEDYYKLEKNEKKAEKNEKIANDAALLAIEKAERAEKLRIEATEARQQALISRHNEKRANKMSLEKKRQLLEIEQRKKEKLEDMVLKQNFELSLALPRTLSVY